MKLHQALTFVKFMGIKRSRTCLQGGVRRLVSLSLCLSVVVLPLSAQAAAWSGIIDPSRAIDWSGAGVVGGIPTNATQCGPTLTSVTSAADINNAIANCSGATASTPKYVLIGLGTFTIGGSIALNKNYVGLRGSGPDQTIIKITAQTCGIMGASVC